MFAYLVERDGPRWVILHEGDPVEWYDTREEAERVAERWNNDQEGA